MPDIGITLTIPADAKALKRWKRLFKQYPKTFDLPEPIGGAWVVQGFETKGPPLIGLCLMTIHLSPIFKASKPKGKK